VGACILPSTLCGGISPICNSCGGVLGWDISNDEYLADKEFWDEWCCKECDPSGKILKAHLARKQSSGSFSAADLAKARRDVALVFEALCAKKVAKDGCSAQDAEDAGKEWLAEQLDVPLEACIFDLFPIQLCESTLNICKPFLG